MKELVASRSNLSNMFLSLPHLTSFPLLVQLLFYAEAHMTSFIALDKLCQLSGHQTYKCALTEKCDNHYQLKSQCIIS